MRRKLVFIDSGKNNNLCLSVLIAFAVSFLSTYYFPRFISDNTTRFSNSYFSVLFFICVFILEIRQNRYNRSVNKDIFTRKNVLVHALALFYSFMTVAGYSLDVYGKIDFREKIIPIFLFTHVIGNIINLIWYYFELTESCLSDLKDFTIFDRTILFLSKHPYLIFLILIVSWCPCFLADFPGGFRYDATAELDQIINGYRNDFPLLHSAIVTVGFPFFYKLTGSWNTGIAVYVIIQMFLFALLYSYIIRCFINKGINSFVTLSFMIWCCLFPVIQLLVTQEVRDILFGLLFMASIWFSFESENNPIFWHGKKTILYGIILSLTVFSRNNAGIAITAFLIVLCIIVAIRHLKENLHGTLQFILSLFFSYILLWIGLTNICKPMSYPDPNSSLTIISQTLARAYLMEKSLWTNDETEELNKYMNTTNLKYYSNSGDPTKQRLNKDINRSELLLFWAKIGKKHLGCYIDGALAMSQDMWFPASVIDGYKAIFTTPGSPYYDFEKNYYSIGPSLPSPAIHRNLLPKVLDFYTNIGLRLSFEKIPVVSMFFSIGSQFWIILFSLFYVIYRRCYKLLVLIIPVLLFMILASFAPLVLLRYYACVFFIMPIIVVGILEPLKFQVSNR